VVVSVAVDRGEVTLAGRHVGEVWRLPSGLWTSVAGRVYGDPLPAAMDVAMADVIERQRAYGRERAAARYAASREAES
jgi:hypothetical protein